MTKPNLPEVVDQTTGELTVYDPPAAWEVVDRGPGEQVTFNYHGDSFQGIYMGREEQDDDKGKKFFVDSFTGADGKSYVIFPGASLERGMRRVNRGEWVRITYTFDLEVDKPSPMKCFTVEVGR